MMIGFRLELQSEWFRACSGKNQVGDIGLDLILEGLDVAAGQESLKFRVLGVFGLEIKLILRFFSGRQ